MEYRERIYSFLINSYGLFDSISQWLKELDYKSIYGIGQKAYNELWLIVNDPDYYPANLTGITNGYCGSVLLDKNRYSALINIFVVEDKDKSNENLFSFVLNFKGGTYISQIVNAKYDTLLGKWLQYFENEELKFVDGMNSIIFEKFKELISLEDSKPKELASFTNVWQGRYLLEDTNELTYLTIIKTKSSQISV